MAINSMSDTYAADKEADTEAAAAAGAAGAEGEEDGEDAGY